MYRSILLFALLLVLVSVNACTPADEGGQGRVRWSSGDTLPPITTPVGSPPTPTPPPAVTWERVQAEIESLNRQAWYRDLKAQGFCWCHWIDNAVPIPVGRCEGGPPIRPEIAHFVCPERPLR